MKPEFKCTLNEKGIILEFRDEKFLMSYEETELTWDKAKEWAAERGGTLFPCKHSIVFAEHIDEINEMLEEAGKETLSGWLWTDREYSTSKSCAWAVNALDGAVGWLTKSSLSSVRAVSALSDDLE